MTSETSTPVHRLKVTLMDSKPAIWRRLIVPSACTLGQLHRILQVAFGWEGYHLHQFAVGDLGYTDPTIMDDLGTLDEDEMTLDDVAPEVGARFVYEYDFGDSWHHMILVEKPAANTPVGPYPLCIAGKMAAPPEDCGGIWGYEAMVDALADPADPEHERWREWLGEDFDPTAFDQEAVNAELRRLA